MPDFMDEDELETPDELPVICRCLRTKTAFGTSVGYRPWQHGASSTAVYWCLRTMETAGPDDNFVHQHRCRSGRSCYQDTDDV